MRRLLDDRTVCRLERRTRRLAAVYRCGHLGRVTCYGTEEECARFIASATDKECLKCWAEKHR